MEFEYILFRKVPFGRFIHSLWENENIPMWGKEIALLTKETAFPSYPDHYLITSVST